MISFPKRMKVAGTHVGKRPEALKKYVNRGTQFVLQREAENIFDPNAIKVKQRFKNGGEFHLGYIPANYAAEMAPEMDQGIEYTATFAIKLMNDQTGEPAGLVINVNRKDELKGN